MAVLVLVLLVFNRWIFFPGTSGDDEIVDTGILRVGMMVIFGFVFFGSLMMALGLFSLHAAWQVAITLTFFHTVLDYVRDLDDAERFGYTVSFTVQNLVLYPAALIVAVLVCRLQRDRNAVRNLFLLAVWSCYLSSCLRSFGYWEMVFPPEGMNVGTLLIEKHSSIFFVHGTFTVSALLTTGFILSRYSKMSPGVESQVESL